MAQLSRGHERGMPPHEYKAQLVCVVLLEVLTVK